MQDREDESQVDRDRLLQRKEVLDAVLDREVGLVDLVVERDDLVGELDVLPLERVEGAPQRAQDEVALPLEGGLDLPELLLEDGPQPNLPVT